MFKVDMDAIREAAIETWLTANPANRADLTGAKNPGAPHTRQMVSQVATLAASQIEKCSTDPINCPPGSRDARLRLLGRQPSGKSSDCGRRMWYTPSSPPGIAGALPYCLRSSQVRGLNGY